MAKAPAYMPWVGEPDADDFSEHGFLCVMRRNPTMKTWCAYVCIPPEHPWYKRSADSAALETVDAHGGITFTGSHENLSLRPVPFVIGFDTNHAWDYAPGMLDLCKEERGPSVADLMSYKTHSYTRHEVTKLAAQAAHAWASEWGETAPPPYWRTVAEWKDERTRCLEGADDRPTPRQGLDRTDEELTACLQAMRVKG